MPSTQRPLPVLLRQRLKGLALRKRIFRKISRLIGRNVDVKKELLLPKMVPKIIWIYWHQGIDKAPRLVKACIASWKHNNPDYDVRILDETMTNEFVDLSFLPDSVGIAHRTDVLRVMLLARFGGVWVDSTIMCAKPLHHWLPTVMQSGFFAFSRPFADRVLSNWFLAAEPQNRLIEAWEIHMRAYWQQAETADHYLIHHYMIEQLIEREHDIQTVWYETPQISADGPHQAQFLLKEIARGGSWETFEELDPTAGCGLHKLSRKLLLSDDALERTIAQLSTKM